MTITVNNVHNILNKHKLLTPEFREKINQYLEKPMILKSLFETLKTLFKSAPDDKPIQKEFTEAHINQLFQVLDKPNIQTAFETSWERMTANKKKNVMYIFMAISTASYDLAFISKLVSQTQAVSDYLAKQLAMSVKQLESLDMLNVTHLSQLLKNPCDLVELMQTLRKEAFSKEEIARIPMQAELFDIEMFLQVKDLVGDVKGVSLAKEYVVNTLFPICDKNNWLPFVLFLKHAEVLSQENVDWYLASPHPETAYAAILTQTINTYRDCNIQLPRSVRETSQFYIAFFEDAKALAASHLLNTHPTHPQLLLNILSYWYSLHEPREFPKFSLILDKLCTLNVSSEMIKPLFQKRPHALVRALYHYTTWTQSSKLNIHDQLIVSTLFSHAKPELFIKLAQIMQEQCMSPHQIQAIAHYAHHEQMVDFLAVRFPTGFLNDMRLQEIQSIWSFLEFYGKKIHFYNENIDVLWPKIYRYITTHAADRATLNAIHDMLRPMYSFSVTSTKDVKDVEEIQQILLANHIQHLDRINPYLNNQAWQQTLHAFFKTMSEQLKLTQETFEQLLILLAYDGHQGNELEIINTLQGFLEGGFSVQDIQGISIEVFNRSSYMQLCVQLGSKPHFTTQIIKETLFSQFDKQPHWWHFIALLVELDDCSREHLEWYIQASSSVQEQVEQYPTGLVLKFIQIFMPNFNCIDSKMLKNIEKCQYYQAPFFQDIFYMANKHAWFNPDAETHVLLNTLIQYYKLLRGRNKSHTIGSVNDLKYSDLLKLIKKLSIEITETIKEALLSNQDNLLKAIQVYQADLNKLSFLRTSEQQSLILSKMLTMPNPLALMKNIKSHYFYIEYRDIEVLGSFVTALPHEDFLTLFKYSRSVMHMSADKLTAPVIKKMAICAHALCDDGRVIHLLNNMTSVLFLRHLDRMASIAQHHSAQEAKQQIRALLEQIFRGHDQSTHAQSVHLASNTTMWMLSKIYGQQLTVDQKIAVKQQFIGDIRQFTKTSAYQQSEKFKAGFRGFNRLMKLPFTFTLSHETQKKCWSFIEKYLQHVPQITELALHETLVEKQDINLSIADFLLFIYLEIKQNKPDDVSSETIIERIFDTFYECQRGNNLNADGVDDFTQADSDICPPGVANKFCEKLVGLSPRILYYLVDLQTLGFKIKVDFLSSIQRQIQLAQIEDQEKAVLFINQLKDGNTDEHTFIHQWWLEWKTMRKNWLLEENILLCQKSLIDKSIENYETLLIDMPSPDDKDAGYARQYYFTEEFLLWWEQQIRWLNTLRKRPIDDIEGEEPAFKSQQLTQGAGTSRYALFYDESPEDMEVEELSVQHTNKSENTCKTA